jgi:hypothetical protein
MNLEELDLCMTKTDADTQRTAREGIESFRQVFEKDQKLSVTNASNRLDIPTTTVHSVCHKTLKKKPYHIQTLHDLHGEDYRRRAAICAELADQFQNDSLIGYFFQ